IERPLDHVEKVEERAGDARVMLHMLMAAVRAQVRLAHVRPKKKHERKIERIDEEPLARVRFKPREQIGMGSGDMNCNSVKDRLH
ncbi:MAG TPA: hypothetical protein VH765_01290, partial [Xanthobacteraceae bacterium]